MKTPFYSPKVIVATLLALVIALPLSASDRDDKNRSKKENNDRPKNYRLENRDTRNTYQSRPERAPVPVQVRRNDRKEDRNDNRRNDYRSDDYRRSGDGPTERQRDIRQANERRVKEIQENRQSANQRRYYNNGRYYYDSSFRRPYYGNSYYSNSYYYNRPRTTVAIGLGSGYSTYDTSYVGTYQREADRPVYRGRQVSEAGEAPLEVEVQRALARLGFYDGDIDGDIGPASRRAIANFQRDNDLPVTGRIDSRLISALELE